MLAIVTPDAKGLQEKKFEFENVVFFKIFETPRHFAQKKCLEVVDLWPIIESPR